MISGFSFARNADTLGYPIVESIRSILPICGEFVIAIGKGSPEDKTCDLVKSINDPKIRIIDTEWTDLEKIRSEIYSQQTNIALQHCTHPWCFYIQCDEIVHEQYLNSIEEKCVRYLRDDSVEGFLFNYKHFWGDYDHHIVNHKWYAREIRIIRNGIGIQSVGDAQSFRKGDEKVKVIPLDAEIFHYGYVRHPRLMKARTRSITVNYWGEKKTAEMFEHQNDSFDYGPLNKTTRYKGTYPAVLQERIAAMDWKSLLHNNGKSSVQHDHDKLKNQILTFIEKFFFGGVGKQPWGHKPFKIIKPGKHMK
jgi:hypothetical protein